ncbi:MAG: hypothetical protein Q4A71_07680 [Actinomycetaceae bacterium]|nr:hypothetical protein [Actinomycetaceae bacterium]
MFHYSAIRWIRDTGNGSTLHLSSVASSLTENQSYKGGFYPAGFHDFVSLLPGNPIVATNAFVLVTVCLVWPLSCGFLASLISKNNAQLSFFATLASVTFVSFPERLVSYGTLWPNAYSYTLIPLALAAVITLLLPADRFSVRGALLSLVTLSGVGIAHPSGIFALSVGLLPFLCSFALKIAKRQIILTKTQLYLCVTSVLIAACTVIKVWMSPLFQNNVASWKRESISGIKDAILEALFENQFSNMGIGNPNPNYLLAILVIAGFVYLLLTRNNWWLIAAWSIAVYLFANSVSLRLPLYNLVGPWYGDPPRLGGIIPLYSTIIVGYGLVGIHNVLLSTARHYKTLPKERPVSIAVVAALALGFFVGTHRFNASGSTLQIQKNYLYFEGGAKLNQLLSPKERNMIERTPIDSKSTILGDPRTGVTFYYALRGNPVIFRHLSGSWDSDDVYLLKNIKNYGSDKKLCRITKRNNIRYLYSDSKLYWPQNQATRQYDSLNNFAKSLPPSAALAHAGKATLYRLPPCDAK